MVFWVFFPASARPCLLTANRRRFDDGFRGDGLRDDGLKGDRILSPAVAPLLCMESMMAEAMNVLGEPLAACCTDPVTGFYRDGYCNTGGGDFGAHVVCAQMTAEFLNYTQAQGNDLSTPRPMFNFPGLKPGDRWCLCASRWKEALDDGVAPPVVLASTHASALEHVSLGDLKRYAVE